MKRLLKLRLCHVAETLACGLSILSELEDEVAQFGRVAGLLVAQDGSLLISEDTNGVIYRVSANTTE